VNWYGISALRMLGLAWDLKAQKLNSVENKTIVIPEKRGAGNNVQILHLGMDGNPGS
jgi:hypothetical protein